LRARPHRLADDERKAAKAAKDAALLQQQQRQLHSTLKTLGIGNRSFGFSSIARPAGAAGPTGGSRAGFSKPELLEVKGGGAAATAAAAARGGAAAAGPGEQQQQQGQQQPGDGLAAPAAGDGTAAAAAAAAATAAAAAAAGGGAAAAGDGAAAGANGSNTAAGGQAAAAKDGEGAAVPLLKPLSLQHQLLTSQHTASGPGGVAPAFVAGGASASRARDGEQGLRELMLADLIAVLERHPLYCRSPQLYALAALAGQPGVGAGASGSGAAKGG
jgi:hypothetical protein